jgi:hypothetical protein
LKGWGKGAARVQGRGGSNGRKTGSRKQEAGTARVQEAGFRVQELEKTGSRNGS